MNQLGIALLMVLCTLFLMTATVMTSYHYWTDFYHLVKNSQQRQKEKKILLSSEKKIINELTKYIGIYTNQKFNEIIFKKEQMKIDKWDVNVRVVDNTNCFNLNALKIKPSDTEKVIETYPWQVFKKLLLVNGIERKKVEHIVYEMFHSYHKNTKHMVVRERRAKNYISYSEYVFKFIYDIDQGVFLKIEPMICSRQDNELLVNVNSLESSNSKYLQAMLFDMINEKDIVSIINSKPTEGWFNLSVFYHSLLSNSDLSLSKAKQLNEFITNYFTVDEYFFNYIFWIDSNEGYYQLTSFIHSMKNKINVTQRRYSFSEQYK